jgi:hypothetical protein
MQCSHVRASRVPYDQGAARVDVGSTRFGIKPSVDVSIQNGHIRYNTGILMLVKVTNSVHACKGSDVFEHNVTHRHIHIDVKPWKAYCFLH